MGSSQLDKVDSLDQMDAETSEGSVEAVAEMSTEEYVEKTEQEDTTEMKKEVEESDTVSFFPPAYLQRYCRVREVLQNLLKVPEPEHTIDPGTGKTVMEVGCAEYGMMAHFKSLLDIVKIIFVDLDRQLLKEKLHYLRPLPAEYLQRISRPQPLVVQAFAGCITKVDLDLYNQNPNIWAIVGIEIIEHLHADVLRGFEETVFGIISPNVVILTTPNSDFNQVFNLPPGKFRHWDHKFEWTRKEFQIWCDKIVCEFKDYKYRIEGICEGPEETRHLGCVSQMVVFERKEHVVKPKDICTFGARIQSNCYEMLQTVIYPNFKETRTPAEIILCDFKYFIDNFIFSRSMLNEYEEREINEVKIPLTRLQAIGEIEKVTKGNLLYLKDVLEKDGFQIVSDNDGDISVLMKVDAYIAANLVDSSSDSSDEELQLCDDMDELAVNRVIHEDDESWE